MNESPEEREAYEIGRRLGEANRGVHYDDVVVPEGSEAWELIQKIDEEERDGLAVYLEQGYYAAQRSLRRRG